MRTAVLFLCHLFQDIYLQRYEKLEKELGGQYDVFWAYQTDEGLDCQTLLARGVKLFPFTFCELKSLGYSPIAETLVPGSPHFVVEYFHLLHPEYDYYWSVEYDVMFTGHWKYFFDTFIENDSDLLASYIELRNVDNEQWHWWQSLSFAQEDELPPKEYVKSFNPIYRLSNKALCFLDDYMKREGNCGHFEVLLPTVLLHHGYSVQDIGGTGKFTPPKCHNRFYIQSVGINNGTIRWRPVFSKEEIEQIKRDNILVHPCKELEKNNKMKHAILIMAHGHISNLHKIIGYFSNDCDCFIHIDKKTILKEEETLLIKKHEQVKLLSQELNVNWGGTSELDCVLFLLEKAYNFSNYDYFHLISGQDYPTRPLSQFLDFFVQNEGKSFIQYIKLPHPRWEHGTFRRLQYYYPYDYASDKENPRHWVHEQVKMQIEKGVKRPVPNAFDCLYGSSQWFSITNEAVNILLDYTRKEPALYRSMWMTFAPEECYVATVLCNLLEKDKIVGFNHRFIRWKFENGNRPANLSKEHFFYLLKDKYFFARKMTPPYSTELLPLIDKYLLKDGVVQLSKTGAWLYDGFLKYEYDSKFAEYVHKLCLDISAKSAIDFGCGPGYYVAKWKEMGLPFVGYDANPYTKSLSSLLCQNEDDFCEIADLTAKLDIEEPFELVVCKDVLPYIPKHLIANVINNLIKLSSHIILLSWHISDIQSYIPHHAVSKERLIDSFAKRNFIVEKFLTSQIQIIMNSEDYLIFIKKGHQIIN